MIPLRPEEVTADWLSEVLGADVATATVTPVGTGQTGATYRVAVTHRAGRTGLPERFVVKLPAQDPAVRERVALSYRSEHAFYTELADTLAVPLPHCYHCDIADDGARFVLLLADMAPAEQGDQLAGCTAAESALAVTALAGLHGPRWCDPAWLDLAATVMPRPDEAGARGLGEITVMAAGTTLERLGDRMSDQDKATVTDAAALIGDWLLGAPEHYSILHGDYRSDNLLFDPDRTEVTVVDWQTLAVGLPARDLSYFMATSLHPADRAEGERDLIRLYHQALSGQGVTGYDIETCWEDYCFGMLQVPLIATLGYAFSAATDRGDQMTLTMLERGCRAIRDLGTLDMVRARV